MCQKPRARFPTVDSLAATQSSRLHGGGWTESVFTESPFAEYGFTEYPLNECSFNDYPCTGYSLSECLFNGKNSPGPIHRGVFTLRRIIGTMSTGQGQVEAGLKHSANTALNAICSMCSSVSSMRIDARLLPGRAQWNLCAGLILLIVAVFQSGCARLPAIDPNGQSIFLPYPATTEIRVPQVHANNGNPGIFPQEAFVTPLPPPACVDGSCQQPGGIQNLFQRHKNKTSSLVNHFAKKDPGKCGEIQLSPLRIVAPVNGEVLLLAGICGKDGYLVKREPLEWMLAPGSVGNFIEVGDDSKGRLCSSFQRGPKVEKLGVDYARGRTSARETLLTKGTPGCDDDIMVAEGQTWLSISSPNEGVSRVTVLAPDSELWDRRRQTATIYWVDSQVNFPAPQVVQAPGPVQLVSRVTQSENLVPAEGWKVRYTILDPNVATFVPPINSNIYVANVDANGQAVVTLAAPPGARGTTGVHMEVIRPARPSENLPELILHQADTTVTFSSPGLEVTAFGPEVAAVGDQVTYKVIMGNPGDIDAENTRLIATLPAGTQVVGASKNPTREVNGSLLWEQNLLPAGQALEVDLTLRLDAPGDVALRFSAEGAPNLRAEAPPVVTRVVAPSVSVRFAPAAQSARAEAEVGELMYYEIDVRNTGPQALVGLLMEIETSPGWQPAEQGGNRIIQPIPMLQPGQTESRGVVLRVVQEGQHTARLRIKSGEGGAVLTQEATVAVTGVPRRPRAPAMDASVRLQPQAYVGEEVLATIIIANRGETTLGELQVGIAYDAALQPFQYDNANVGLVRAEAGQPRLTWTPPTLQPGQYARLIINCRAIAPTTQAGIGVNATSGTVTANAQGQIQILSSSSATPGGVNPPVNPPVIPPGSNLPGSNLPGSNPGSVLPPPTQAAQPGNWDIQIIDLNDPTTVNVQRSYTVLLTNKQGVEDSNVRIEVGLPQGVDWNGVTDGTGQPWGSRYQSERGTWVWDEIRFVRPNDPIRMSFSVTPRVPQEMLCVCESVHGSCPILAKSLSL